MFSFPVDEVVVSANEHPLYLPFWPLIAWAYRTVLGVEATLVFLSERRQDDPFVRQLRAHGKVVLVRPVRDIPQAAQAKLARYHYAAQWDDRVIYIDDIDWIPIDRDWHVSKVAPRTPGSLLLIGSEVYGGEECGQAPASGMTAEGRVFRALFNPEGHLFPEYLQSLSGRPGPHREVRSRVNHEGMDCTTNELHLKDQTLFSDEALVVQLRAERPVPVTFVEREYTPGEDTIDRAAWPFSPQKLARGDYLGAHTGRPLSECLKGNLAICEYLRERYGGTSLPPLLEKVPQVDLDMVFSGSGIVEAAFQYVAATIDPARSSILEFGSGHVSTNYLTRYYWVTSVEDDLAFVNLYPAHYIYAPNGPGGWYNPDLICYGLSRYPPYLPYGLILVDGPVSSERRAGFIEHLGIFDLGVPVLVDDVGRDREKQIVWAVASRTGREPVWYDSFAVV